MITIKMDSFIISMLEDSSQSAFAFPKPLIPGIEDMLGTKVRLWGEELELDDWFTTPVLEMCFLLCP